MLKLTALNTNQINYVNIGLMALSAVLAYVLPFELFLFSYAILGPLHYLTEIGWLHKKNYFTSGKYDFAYLVILCVVVFYFSYYDKTKNNSIYTRVITYALLLSLIFVLIKDNLYRVALAFLALIGLLAAKIGFNYFVWIGIFVPTIIHVFLFTWAFMLFGVLKNKSVSGYLSILALVIIAILFFVIKAPSLQYEASAYIKKSYHSFALLNKFLIDFLGLGFQAKDFDGVVYGSNAGFIIMRFIAFAYTYHYLNWFSKTSVIQWHKQSKVKLGAIAIIWVLSIALYAYDYALGLKALYFLSMLHVFLEFPLNIVSFQGIFKSIGFSKG